jgi:hypothetical protein
MPVLTPGSPEFESATLALDAYDFIMRQAVEYPGLEYLDPPKGPGFQFKDDEVVLSATCRDARDIDNLYRFNFLGLSTMRRSEAWLERSDSYVAVRYLSKDEGSLAINGIVNLREKIAQV